MTGSISSICRHPIKGLGEEVLSSVTLEPGHHMPFDRAWAICHGASEYDHDNPAWVKPRNFVNQAFVPKVAQITTAYDEASGHLTLDHPDASPLVADPDRDGQAICDWLLPLAEDRRPGPYRIARAAQGGLTDFKDTHIAINSIRGLSVLEDAAQATLHRGRFRSNLWIDGLEPWQEFEWVGKEIGIGAVTLRITERIQRCSATTANPSTGRQDVPVTRILHDNWGHMDFGVYAQVVTGGTLHPGDQITAR